MLSMPNPFMDYGIVKREVVFQNCTHVLLDDTSWMVMVFHNHDPNMLNFNKVGLPKLILESDCKRQFSKTKSSLHCDHYFFPTVRIQFLSNSPTVSIPIINLQFVSCDFISDYSWHPLKCRVVLWKWVLFWEAHYLKARNLMVIEYTVNQLISCTFYVLQRRQLWKATFSWRKK